MALSSDKNTPPQVAAGYRNVIQTNIAYEEMAEFFDPDAKIVTFSRLKIGE
jgi:hypothetical protein